MIFLLFNVLMQYTIHFVKPFSLEQMRMGWISHKSNLTGNFKYHYLLDCVNIYHYQENNKQRNNEIR